MDLLNVTNSINGVLWGTVMIVLCLGSAIYYTVRTRGAQFRLIGDMVGSLKKDQTSQSGITPFQGFAMALGGRIGVGSIAGVATAIYYGGPGAVFWMWVYAFFGAATSFAESVLAQIWKADVNGEYKGGPAYYLRKTPLKFLGTLTAFFGICAFGFTGPTVQAFNIADSFKNAFGLNTWITGIALTLIFGVVVFGGMKRIGRFAEFAVPFMAGAYFMLTLIVLVVNAGAIPGMLVLIVKSAFNMESIYGGVFGSAIIWGVKRSLYSSEAGMGTGANAAASAEVSHPVKQGLAQAFSVYNTLIVCTCTALMILVTGMFNVVDASGEYIVHALPNVEAGIGFTQAAIDVIMPGGNLGSIFLAVAIFFFAITTLLSFGFYAQVSISAIFKNSRHLKLITAAVTLVQMFAIVFGSVKSAALAWNIADIGVGILAWLNVIGLMFLAKPVVAALKDYEHQKKQGLDPVFRPSACGIEGAELWEDIADNKYKHLNKKSLEDMTESTKSADAT